MPSSRKVFEIKIPSNKVQDAWNDFDSPPSKNKAFADDFIDFQQSMLSEVCRDFAGKKVRMIFEIIR